MKQNICLQCNADWDDIILQGFINNFRIDQNGVIHFGLRKFDLGMFVLYEVKTCITCAKSTYLIIIPPEDIKGHAVEFWEI